MMTFSRIFNVVFGDEPAATPPPNDAAPPATPPSTPPSPTFTQKDIDAVVAKRVAEEKVKANKEKEQLLKQVSDFNLTKQEKEALEAKLEELRVSSLSKEEQAKDREQKLMKKHEVDLRKAQDERDQIFNTYKEEKIEREIISAVSAPDVFDAAQMADLLRSKTRLAPEMVDGKETGKLITKVKHVLIQEGKPVEVELSPVEVVKAMREDPRRYGNQFTSGATGGLGSPVGGGRPTNAGKVNAETMPMDQFVETFHKDPAKLGLTRRPRGTY
jgi:hypothetical protein